MTCSRSLLVLACLFALAGLGPAPASAADAADPSLEDVKVHVVSPFRLTIRDLSWSGDPHARPVGRAVLERADGRAIWDRTDVTGAVASGDGTTVALQTSDYELYVSRLPDMPQRVDGGPYQSPALSRDGKQLVAQRLGESGHILQKTLNAKGIALVNLESGRDRLLLEGNDLYLPSFATDQRIFFGSGGEDGVASLYILDLAGGRMARVTNRAKGARQTFPSEAPVLVGGAVVYRADTEQFRVPEPEASDFEPVRRFDAPNFVDAQGVSPDASVVIRRPTVQTNQTPHIYNYYDLDKRAGFEEDWFCNSTTYDGHQGTDFNQKLGYDVLAPASGRIFWRHDGCADANSPGCGFGFGNFAAMVHSDGSVSLESHGKKWTVAERGVTLNCGAKLMESAKSGNANAYHVHHESWTSQAGKGNLSLRYDPFKGSCDPTAPTKWTVQNQYRALPAATCQ